jgi:hypothetical protein
MGHIPKQLIQLAHRLFDLANLAFPLNDQVLLEIDFGLLCECGFFQELLLGLVAGGGRGAGLGFFEGGFGCALFFDGAALDDLEFGERRGKFAGEFLVGISLRGLLKSAFLLRNSSW